MKTWVIFLVTIGFYSFVEFLIIAIVEAQNKPVETWVYTAEGYHYGYLYRVEDNELTVKRLGHTPTEYISFIPTDIEQIELRRIGGNKISKIIGGACGIIAGVLIGLSAGDDYGFIEISKEAKAASLGVGLGLAGYMVGGMLGSIKVKIPINKSADQFKANRPKLESYIYPRKW